MRIPPILRLLSLLGLLLSGLLVSAPRQAAARSKACFAETGHCIRGRFLAYWTANGGLAINGFPLTDERQELLEDGRTYTVQYFERVRMESHPENAYPYDVLLGQLGRRALADSLERAEIGGYRGDVKATAAKPGAVFFPATGHNLGGRFLDYWQANGGLAQFGYPLTEEGQERLGSATPAEPVASYITVQYFERARFEYHPENAGSPYDVLLGQFGRFVAADNQLLSGSFGRLYLTNQAVQQRMGEPTTAVFQVSGATQEFERGRMIYRGDQRQIYVLCGDPRSGRLVVDLQTGTPAYQDTWMEGQDPGGGPAPSPGLFYPSRGFGKVWRSDQFIQQCLGYARTAGETGYTLQVQEFGRGDLLLSTPDGNIYVVDVQYFDGKPGGTYERFAAPTP